MRDLTAALALLAAILVQGCTPPSGAKLTASSATPARPTSVPAEENGFTAYLATKLGASLGDDGSVRIIGPLTLGARLSGDPNEVQANLDRLWDYCGRAPDGCDQAAAEFVKSVSDLTQSSPVEKATIRAVVRTSEYLAGARRELPDGPSNEPVAVSIAGDLWLVCVIDSPRSARWLLARDLAQLGLSKDEAVALAKRNVAEALPPLRAVAHPLGQSEIGQLDGDAYYESIRLLLHEDWAVLAGQSAGRLIVAAPHSGLVVYGDTGQPNAIQVVRLVARKATRGLLTDLGDAARVDSGRLEADPGLTHHPAVAQTAAAPVKAAQVCWTLDVGPPSASLGVRLGEQMAREATAS